MQARYSYDRRKLDPAKLVTKYMGRVPSPKNLRYLTHKQWATEVPETSEDRLMGGVSAITLPDGAILIREGFEDSAVHELLHIVGLMPDGISEALNEGVTQAVAEEICDKAGIPVRRTYAREVKFAQHYILPLMGQPLREFARDYAAAPDKGAMIVDRIWGKYSQYFDSADDWGDSAHIPVQLLKDLRSGLDYSLYLEYLVDELQVG